MRPTIPIRNRGCPFGTPSRCFSCTGLVGTLSVLSQPPIDITLFTFYTLYIGGLAIRDSFVNDLVRGYVEIGLLSIRALPFL